MCIQLSIHTYLSCANVGAKFTTVRKHRTTTMPPSRASLSRLTYTYGADISMMVHVVDSQRAAAYVEYGQLQANMPAMLAYDHMLPVTDSHTYTCIRCT
jgi:hypothetical protein